MPPSRFPPLWSSRKLSHSDRHPANDTRAGDKAQAASEDTYELDAFQPNLTRAEADFRIAMLTAKLKLLDGPPHTR
jgi:hypothetical protein